MSKTISAKVGTYTKDGKEKGEYIKIGVILENENGQYALIDPSINVAGVLQKQNRFNHAQKKKTGDMLMCSIFDNENKPAQQSDNAGEYMPKDNVPF